LSGFYKYTHVLESYTVHWSLIALFVLLGIVGSFVGSALSQTLNQRLLKKLFALLLVVMGTYILYENLPSVLSYALSLWILAGVVTIVLSGFLLLGERREEVSIR
jgi:multidrug transporter EmrE-like cation transporter